MPGDVADIAPDMLPHRLVLSFDALADGRTADEIVGLVLAGVDPPRVAPSQGTRAEAPLPQPAPTPAPYPQAAPPPTPFPEPGAASQGDAGTA